ncbi:MAG: hypothetical protein IJ518_02925 [Clostridia bacterium]|nr:hypothetical protein [Clostridia bacterium]
MKKLVSILVLLAMLVSMTACNKEPAGSDPVSTPTQDGAATTTETADTTTTGSEADETTTTAGDATTTVGGGKNTTATTAKKVTTTTTKAPAKNYTLKVSDFVKDESVWATNYVEGTDGFTPYTGFGHSGPNAYVPRTMAEKNITHHKLGELYYSPYDGKKGMTGEWGYTFLNLNGYTAGDGMLAEGCGWIVNKPKNDKDALAIMRNWLFKQYANPPYNLKHGDSGMGSMNGHTLFQHYAADWGFDSVGSEIGENILMHQAHMAFTRGAARQYDVVGNMYFSNWNASTIGTWETYPSWPQGGPTKGHSMSLLKRSYLMSYMGGASSFTFEVGCRLAFYGTEKVDNDGWLELSPYGKTMQELVAFSTKNSDIGYTYTPIGVALDYFHGRATYSTLPGSSGYRYNMTFGYFPNTAGDDMYMKLFGMLYPEAGDIAGKGSYAGEQYYQVNTPYGDTHDVIMHNASQKVLNSYPVLVMAGDIALSSAEAKRYVAYVQQGGTLICNTAYLKYFDSYKAAYKGGTRQDIKDGKGTVIVYGPDYSVDNLAPILQEQLKKYVPFTISDTVEYVVNVKNGSLILTLINNAGVTKDPNQDPVIDKSKAKNLTIKYTGNLKIKQVKELYYGTKVSLSGNSVNITVAPGDVQVLEFVFD